ncbi:maleylpyruvate isomerase family mycothiol-dependent enzyme [Mycobacterium sp. 2YAF39]|uniref:maleylpyruvate isomerase family mycothiol-dependent enzyme n=1 Tax=Mycobacterium sp. 2YAF39 TaxID=3233033 RepID=UPI003F960A27
MSREVDEQIFTAVAAERRRIADLIDTLDEDALATPSLCAGWDVKTVAAHLVSVFADGFWKFQFAALRYRGFNRAIDELARRRARESVTDIAQTLRLRADHRLSPPITGPFSGLTDVLVHSGDIRIPLGLPFHPDDEKVSWALDFLTGPHPLGFVPRGRLKGISLHGEDIGRAWGSGAEIHGPGALLMMAVAGRTDTLAMLDGPGVGELRRRLSVTPRRTGRRAGS